MIIFYLSLLVSLLLSVFVTLSVTTLDYADILPVLLFFLSSFSIVVEILKWPLGKRIIDNSKGLSKHIYKEAAELSYKHPFFLPRESIISVKGDGIFAVWSVFIGSIIAVIVSLYYLFYV
jgi:hypothetical protein